MKTLYNILITFSIFFFNSALADDKKNIVGVLLPTSSDNKFIGKSVKNAVIMATYKYAPTNVVVKFYDTQSSNIGAKTAYDQAIKDGAKIIVGPISGANTGWVRNNQKYGVPILSLSNDADYASTGIYITGYTPQSQGFGIVKIMEYLNKQSAIAIIPKNKFGSAVETGLSSAEWGTIKNVYYYDPTKYDFSKLVQEIVEERQYYNYDAIIIPDSNPKNVKILSSQLSYYDAFDTAEIESEETSKIHLIGGLGWDKINNTHREPGLLGGYYLSSPKPSELEQFKSTYQSLYGVKPNRLVVLAYDMTALAIISASSENTEKKLMQDDGYRGISGTFKMSAYGVVERVYNIKKVLKDRTFVPERGKLQIKTKSN